MSALIRAHLETGLGLQVAGQFAEAEAIYGQVIAQAPHSAEAWHLLGMARFQQGDYQGAVDSIGRALSIDGSQAVFFGNLGAALEGLNRNAEAMAAYRAALAIRPDQYDAACNLLRLLLRLSQVKLAAQLARQLVSHHAHGVELLGESVNAALAVGDLPSAQKWLENLVAMGSDPLHGIEPVQHAMHLKQLGVCLCKQRQFVAAIRSLSLVENDPEASFWLSIAYAETSDLLLAQKAIRNAQSLQPHNAALRLREACLAPNVYPQQAAIDEVRGSLESWLDEQIAGPSSYGLQELFAGRFVPPYSLSYNGRDNRRIKEKFATLCRRSIKGTANHGRSTSKRIRVGFMVSPGRERAFLQCRGPILKLLNRSEFEVFVACAPDAASMIAQSIGASQLNLIPLSDEFAECVKRIREAALDVLYYWEVGSDPLNYLLPFARPAAVQCTSFGTQVTSGIHELDFYLTSSLAETPEGDSRYTEKLWRLNSLLSYKPALDQSEPMRRSDLGLSDRGTLYLCPRRLDAVHPEQDQMFAELLRRDPGATLAFIEMHCPSYHRQLHQRFQRMIPDVASRIAFQPRRPTAEYRRLIASADVVLDTIHSSAANTAYDVLGVDRPLVTTPGKSLISRYTTACYARCGLSQLIAPSTDAYVEMALRLAKDTDYRKSAERALQEQSRSLFDDVTVVKEHERFFRHAGELARTSA